MIEPSCTECPLGNTPQVLGLGTRTEGTKLFAVRDDRPFDLVIVAMAPADEEMRQEMPMVGPSGQYLRKTLRLLGVDSYYITNCLLCPIKPNHTDADIRKAQQCCRARLHGEVEERHPKLILSLGEMPLQEFCGRDYQVRENEGRLLLSDIGIPLVPVAHPAYYLRRPDDAFDFLESTRAGVRYLQNNYHQALEPIKIEVDAGNLKEVRHILLEHEHVAVDTETTGFNALGLKPDRILETGLSIDEKTAYIIPPEFLLNFKDIIETKKMIGWNLFFDARFLIAAGVHPNLYFDGMLAHYCLDERQHSHGLKKVARVYLGAGDWEANIKQYLKNPKEDSYEIIPTEVRRQYLAKDVCYTFQLWELLSKEIGDNWPFWHVLMPATRVFTDSMYHGVLIDPYKVVEIHKLLWDDINRDERELWKMTGRTFNPASPKEVSEILFDDLGIPENADPKFSRRSTNKDILEKWRDEYEFVDRLILHREMRHDVSQYIEGFAKRIDQNFRVHPTIRMFGAVTGRISSENPSIMNIKRNSRVKELFIAGPGKYLAEFDLKGAELRWYCLYANDEVLMHILNEGYDGDLGIDLTEEQRRDPHYIIGAIAYGPQRAVELRAAAKMTVFGRLYMRGLKSIERQYGRDTARRLVSVMDEIIPHHKHYVNTIKQQVRTQGYVESYFGRKRNFPLITNENRSKVDRQATNMPIQSASSDLNLLNLVHIWGMKEKWDVMPLFTVHDSILMEIPSPDVIPEIKKELEEHANSIAGGGRIKFIYDVKWGINWAGQKPEEVATLAT